MREKRWQWRGLWGTCKRQRHEREYPFGSGWGKERSLEKTGSLGSYRWGKKGGGVQSESLQPLYLPEFAQIHVRWVQGWYLTISPFAAHFCSLQGRGTVYQGSQRGQQWRRAVHTESPQRGYRCWDLDLPSNILLGEKVIGGAEKESELKGNIASWGCQRVGRKGGQRWRTKGRNMEDHQRGWRESNLTGNRWQREAGWKAGKK